METLDEYRETLERIGPQGTVSAAFAREIVDVAEAELEEAHGEYTIAQAMEMSGRSRAYFTRRLDRLEREGLARKPGREWLIRRAAIPERLANEDDGDGFEPGTPASEIADRVLAG